ncbi:MAG: hypothetical protein QNL21_03700 [Flavobacteriales bacterium]
MYKWTSILVLFLSVTTVKTLAQDETTGDRNEISYSSEAQKEVLLVPMMDKMFLSNVIHEIGRYNEMDFREVRSFFKGYISDMVALNGAENWRITHANSLDSITHKIQIAQGFDYDLITVHSKVEETRVQKIWNKLQETTEEKYSARGAYLENGELKEFYDGKSRFMNTKVDTGWVFGQVLADSDFDYLLFINELDINKPRPTDANFGSRERTLKLHFTLYNSQGKRLYGNAAFSTFAEEELDIYAIANDALFSAINRMLAECSAELTILSK